MLQGYFYIMFKIALRKAFGNMMSAIKKCPWHEAQLPEQTLRNCSTYITEEEADKVTCSTMRKDRFSQVGQWKWNRQPCFSCDFRETLRIFWRVLCAKT